MEAGAQPAKLIVVDVEETTEVGTQF